MAQPNNKSWQKRRRIDKNEKKIKKDLEVKGIEPLTSCIFGLCKAGALPLSYTPNRCNPNKYFK